MKTNFLFLVILLTLGSCAMKPITNVIRKESPLPSKSKVVILGLESTPPPNAVKLGEVKFRENGLSVKCSEDRVNFLAREAARKMGGNLVKITKETLPNVISSCYRMNADIYKVDKIDNLQDVSFNEIENPILKEKADNFAVIHFFRNNGTGFAIGYNIMIGDDKTPVTRSKYKFRSTVITNKLGKQKIWGKTEVTKELTLDLQAGKEYYVDSEIGMGVMVGHPSFRLVRNDLGKKQYLKIPETKEYTTDYLILKDGRIIACDFDKRQDDTYLFSVKKNGKYSKTSLPVNKVDKVILKSELIPK